MNSPATPSTDVAPALRARAGKYLTVALADESYGIAVEAVREIIRLQRITPVPHQPPHVRGVINLRGRVIPILDLRVRFELPARCDDRACIVVVQVRSNTGLPAQMGFVVDRVEDVALVGSDDLQPTPEFGVAAGADVLLGLARLKQGVHLLLDIDAIVNGA